MNHEDEIKELKSLLDYHDNLYYNEDDPEISDIEYDSIKKRYLKLTGKTEYDFVPGKAINSLDKVTHPLPIRSLGKVNTEEEVRNAIAKLLPVVIEPKFDGLTVVGYSGNETRAGIFATRGNGFVGENITRTALKIEDINRVAKISYNVRMEAYMPISTFNQINTERIANGEKPFKNPRNAAAGMLRHKAVDKVCGIHYFAYNIVGSEWQETDQLASLQSNGFHTTPYWEFDNVDDAVDFIMNFDRHQLDYEIDGLVIKSNIPNSLAHFGVTGHHPKNAVAYKFLPEGVWTTLRGVIWQVGRTGKLTPVAEIDPVDIGGSTISRVTLHNIGIINALGIRIGYRVFVIKANDVIPAITEAEETPFRDTFPVIEPQICPECKGTVVRINNQSFCMNPDCPAKRVARLVHIAGREALDIEGLSEETAQKLFDAGIIDTPFEVFNVTVEQLSKLPGFAKRSAEKLYDAIQKARNPELAKFIYATGIPGVGRSMSRDIASKFGSFEEWTKDAGNSFIETKKIEGVGEESIKNLNEHGHLLGELAEYITPKTTQKKAEPTSGKVLTFVITGTLDNPRSYYEKLITDAGHKASGSVSAKTDYVLVGTDPGSKYQKAIDLGFESKGKILRSEEELRSKL
jgi:DNA ligase (NAD+)